MKIPFLPLLMLLFASVMGTALAVPPPGWTEDYAKALEKAKTEKKNLLLDFTGSDWCGYCKLLDKEVFATAEFKSWAKDNVVLVKVDFPHSTPQTAKVKQQNSELKSQHPVNGYPTVVILDPEGKELAKKVGYHPGSGPTAYLEEFKATTKPQ
jgi:thioredoxin-related protein